MKRVALIFLASLCAAQTKVDYPTQIKNGPIASDAGPAGTTLPQLCIGSSGSLAVTRVWAALSTQTITGCSLFFSGGLIQPAGGQTVTFTVQSAPLTQICDLSLGGNCIINSADGLIFGEWWGAVPGNDSTAAFQAALNDFTLTNANLKLTIPNNNTTCYKISTTVTYTGAITFDGSVFMDGTVSSAGGKGSCFLWTGAAGGIIFHLIDAHKPRIKHISFQGNALALVDLWLDASDDTMLSTQSADFIIEDDSFSGGQAGAAATGLRLSHSACTFADVANGIVKDSAFVGNGAHTDTGIDFQCGGNSKNITLTNNNFQSLGTGFSGVGSSDGYTTLEGGYFGANTLDIFQELGRLNVIGTGSEGSTRFIAMGAGNNLCSLNAIGNYWNGIAAANDHVIDTTGCALSLTHNNLFNSRTPGVTLPKIILSAGFPPNCAGTLCGNPALFSSNNFFANTDSTHGAYYDSGGGALGVPYGAYYNANANQAPVEVIGDYGGPNLFTMSPLPNYSFAQARVFTPASLSAICTPPQVAYDTSVISTCTAANTWSQVPYMTSGTFSPVLTFGGATTGIAQVNTGTYTRMGHTVSVTLSVRLSSVGTAVGVALITGLPFSAAQPNAGSIGFFNGFDAGITVTPTIQANVGFSSLGLFKAVTGVQLTNADFTNTSFVSLTLSYQTP